jgi:hypothetical protein
MVFFFVTIALMYIGRRVGWFISRNILYTSPIFISIVLCVGWGFLVALTIYSLIEWQQPHIVLKIIMGYALGAYVSIPNFALFQESSLPENVKLLDSLIYAVSFFSYVIFLVLLSYNFITISL